MTPSWLLNLLAAVMLVVAAASVAQAAAIRLMTPRPWRPVRSAADVDVAHAVMAVAMAGMLAPGLAMLPATAGEIVFGLMTAWFAGRAWLSARGVRGAVSGRGVAAVVADTCTLHAVHCLAMLYMYLALRSAAGSTSMGATAMGTPEYPTLAGILALLLVGYSVWNLDQLSCMGAAAVRVQAGRALALAPGMRVGWQVVLGVTMAFMLLIMI